MDTLTSRLSTRFLVVTVAPNVLFVLYVGFLLAAGAPARTVSLARAIRVLRAMTPTQFIVLLVAVMDASVVSVAVIVWLPDLSSVADNVAVPSVRALLAGSVAVASVLVK